jgi:nucleotide-binding universal stress UspA family protein
MVEAVNTLDVLVPLDGSDRSERALRFALALAPSDRAIRLITVLEPVDRFMSFMPGAKSMEALQRATSDAADDYIQKTAEQLRAISGVKVTTRLAHGEPSEEILAAASDPAISTIVMSSAGRGALGRIQFGSVADRIARSSTIPIVIVRDEKDGALEPAKIERIVVPLDGSRRALEALPAAAGLAKRLEIPILLVTAKDPNSLMLAYGASLNSAEYEHIAASIAEEAAARIEAPARELEASGISVDSVVVTGSAAHAISSVCGDNDLIVMTSHGRGGVVRWMIGSVAEKLIREAPVPVMLVPARD